MKTYDDVRQKSQSQIIFEKTFIKSQDAERRENHGTLNLTKIY